MGGIITAPYTKLTQTGNLPNWGYPDPVSSSNLISNYWSTDTALQARKVYIATGISDAPGAYLARYMYTPALDAWKRASVYYENVSTFGY